METFRSLPDFGEGRGGAFFSDAALDEADPTLALPEVEEGRAAQPDRAIAPFP
jgi:hypothetical protein